MEKQTRKLFEVCRLRKIPVLTFINKMDMPGRDPLELMNEVENVLQIHSYAMNWPIGIGQRVPRRRRPGNTTNASSLRRPLIGGAQKADIAPSSEKPGSQREDRPKSIQQLARRAGSFGNGRQCLYQEDFLAGEVTPVFFASALTNFGVEPFFDAFIHLAPCPHARMADRPDGTEDRNRSDQNPL